jgi:hypothetical protein
VNVDEWRRAASEYWPEAVEHYFELLFAASEFKDASRDPYLALVIGTRRTIEQYATLEAFTIAAVFAYVESSGHLSEREELVNAATPKNVEGNAFKNRLAAVLSQLATPPDEHLPRGPIVRAIQLYDSTTLQGGVADVSGTYVAYFAENLAPA